MDIAALCEPTSIAPPHERAAPVLYGRLPGLENGAAWDDFIANGIAKLDATSIRPDGLRLDSVLYERMANETSAATLILLDLCKSRLSLSDADLAPRGPGEKLGELRQLLGYAWADIAELLDVDRRSLFSWSSNAKVRPKNLERLAKLLHTVKFIDRGSVERNQDLLMAVAPDGGTMRELLAGGHFELVKRLVGKGDGRPAAGTPMDPAWLQAYGRTSMSASDVVIPDKVVPVKRAPAKGKVRRTIPRA